MKRIVSIALLMWGIASAREKRLPSGETGNEAVAVVATVFDSDQLKQTFGTDFANGFVVIEVTLTPRGGQPFDVHLDDFLLRSEQTGEHSGPLAASQIAGSGTLVVHEAQQKRGGGGFGGFGGIMMGGGGMGSAPPMESGKAEIKNSDKKDPLLDILKRKILPEKPISDPVTGLLFFPLEKEKPKNLNLTLTTVPGKLRMKFK